MKIWILLVCPLLLTGCLYGQCLDGPCALERERMIKAIKPRLQYYEKPGWSPESRRLDAATCGASGDSSDHAGIGSTRIKAAQRPGETDGQTEMRLRQEWHTCMKDKGYQDIRAQPR